MTWTCPGEEIWEGGGRRRRGRGERWEEEGPGEGWKRTARDELVAHCTAAICVFAGCLAGMKKPLWAWQRQRQQQRQALTCGRTKKGSRSSKTMRDRRSSNDSVQPVLLDCGCHQVEKVKLSAKPQPHSSVHGPKRMSLVIVLPPAQQAANRLQIRSCFPPLCLGSQTWTTNLQLTYPKLQQG